MSDGFPTYSYSAKQGDRGVGLVSRVVSDHFQWLFKRNHQEHDFGIDGQIEFVTPAGAVTGQMIAAQIKYGESFFTEQNMWGYVYRGEKKHFNYLANYPIPVIICICDPKSEKCYWVRFEADKTEMLDKGWKITVPFQNVLPDSKAALEALVPAVSDSLSELESYWKFNKLAAEASAIVYSLDKDDVEAGDVVGPRALFDRLRVTKELAHACQTKVEFSFSGYDDDPRELFEIDNVRRYVARLDEALPELFFFARNQEPTSTLKTFLFCVQDVKCVDDEATPAGMRKVEVDYAHLERFLGRHFAGLNEMTEWLGMSYEENKHIGLAAVKCMEILPGI
jgi:hypothetical protein